MGRPGRTSRHLLLLLREVLHIFSKTTATLGLLRFGLDGFPCQLKIYYIYVNPPLYTFCGLVIK